jgi:hypothetical protein
MIVKNKKERMEKMSKLDQAMNYQYARMSQDDLPVQSITKPVNYPLGFDAASQAVEILNRYNTRSRERQSSRER